MFNELVSLGRRLEQDGELPPPGFYFYSKNEPIKWVVHFDPEEPEKSEIRAAHNDKLPRPFSGRTSGVQAYPLADEAAYVFGVDRGVGRGKKIKEKQKAFLSLLDDISESIVAEAPQLSSTIRNIKGFIANKHFEKSSNWEKIESKDWVAFQLEAENGDEKYLIEHPTIRKFWIKKLATLCEPEKKGMKSNVRIAGECGISGKSGELVGRIPLSVKLYKPAPLHSLNADSFVSGMEGVEVFKRTHVGQSIESGDLIARTLNYLSNKTLHSKVLARAIEKGKLKNDSHNNLFAFYWIENPESTAAASVSINVSELLANASLVLGGVTQDENDEERGMAEGTTTETNLPGTLSQLEALLNIPWTGQSHGLGLGESAFCFLMLSPNKGRISVREWFKVGLEQMRGNLSQYLDAQRIENSEGKEPRCFQLGDMLRALEETNISLPRNKPTKELANPNITRALLRCAYLGEAPPAGLLERAVICFRHPKVLKRYEEKLERDRFAGLQHKLASVMKMILTHPKSEVNMNNSDQATPHETRSSAFLSGGLLAVLEAAQLAALNWKINTTMVDQFYSTASSAPNSVMGMLISRVTSQHMPKLRKNMPRKYATIENLLEEFQTALVAKGGFPRTLSMKQQAEFSLGFYTQRSRVASLLKNESTTSVTSTN